jgi:hypothetical protein
LGVFGRRFSVLLYNFQMPARPARLWKDLPVEKRVQAAEAFWRDESSPDVQVQQMEATLLLARRLNFRPKSVSALAVERRARLLAQVGEVSDAVATRALIAYHFAAQRPLMGAFLDALGIGHDQGLITDESVDPPARDRLAAALDLVRATFNAEDVDLYARTLAVLDGETWRHLDELPVGSPPSGT